MRQSLIYLAFVSLIVATGRADAQTPLSDHAQLIKGCLDAAADGYRLPPAALAVLLNVEGG